MYIYIFEDGRFGWSYSGPKQDDLVCIAEGTLNVIKLWPRKVLQPDSVILAMEVQEDGNMTNFPQAELEDSSLGCFHYIEGHE